MSYRQIVDADARLAILQALEQDPGYSHNEHVLREIVRCVGHELSYDSLRAHLAWLEEQGLVTQEEVAGIIVARITSRGQDAALGRARVPGVARPRPEA